MARMEWRQCLLLMQQTLKNGSQTLARIELAC
jgi:hypothetical protein